jgi:hypothetical protein
VIDGPSLISAAIAELAEQAHRHHRRDPAGRDQIAGMTAMAVHLVRLVYPGSFGATFTAASEYVAEEVQERLASWA